MNEHERDVPLVSVIVPTYEHEQFIAATLDSVLEQDYDNLEIVVSDDASSDTTAEVVRTYVNRYPGKVYLHVQPRNVGVARNASACFSACKGKYVVLFAGDDVMLPGKLRSQVELLEQHPDCVMCYHDVEVFDSDSGTLLYYFNRGRRFFEPRQGGADLLVRHGVFCAGTSVMIRREAAPAGLWNDAIPVASDWLFMIEVATRGKLLYIDKVLARYRKHRGGLTARPVGYDALLTLQIVARKYPLLRRASQAHRRRFFHRIAARAFLQRQFRVSVAYLMDWLRAWLK